jgi:tetratricopeptide (TPR) repeat protein
MSRVICIILFWFALSAIWTSDGLTQDHQGWKFLLKRGYDLSEQRDRSSKLLGAEMLWRAYLLRPTEFDSLIAGSKSSEIKASHASKKSDIAKWGKQGWDLAQEIIKRWPERAEGYFWASINIGQYARGGGVWTAIRHGLAGKIEQMALESIKRNPKLYAGAAQRILGRYYYKLPWPMRKLPKSLKYLTEAYQQYPQNVTGMQFLAETLWDSGQKTQAIEMFRRCANAHTAKITKGAAHFCRQWLQKRRLPLIAP